MGGKKTPHKILMHIHETNCGRSIGQMFRLIAKLLNTFFLFREPIYII